VTIPLTDLSFGNIGIMKGGWNLSMVVDLGFTQTWLPTNITNVLFPLVAGLYTPADGVARIDCAQANNKTLLELTTSWPQWTVPLSELVTVNPTGTSDCVFGIQNADTIGLNYPYTLGITVLRSIYMVFDLANGELSIAETLDNVTTSNIAQINSGINGVPGAIRAPTSSSSASHRLTSGAKAGIAVGAIVGACVLASLIGYAIWFLRRRRRLAEEKNRNVNEKPELMGDSPVSPESMLAKSKASVIPRGSKEFSEAAGNEIYEAPGDETKLAAELPGSVAELEDKPSAVELEDNSPAELEDTSPIQWKDMKKAS